MALGAKVSVHRMWKTFQGHPVPGHLSLALRMGMMSEWPARSHQHYTGQEIFQMDSENSI